ncbi:hypothetical protein NQ318_022023 [Aromia moschata]|uniref:Uncharacterized protein n=1 Tax=Aromia moschata TaxID=1265417 RepID=A0AAV8Z786_9CUCU|nr:hypothetical protein NQ318_022023 [Aromia moschata]
MNFSNINSKLLNSKKRLRNCRAIKKNLEELLNFQPLTDSPQSDIFKDNSHIEALGIMQKDVDASSPPTLTQLKRVSLTKDIIDVAEYNSDGIIMIENDLTGNYIQLNHAQRNNDAQAVHNQSANTHSRLSFQPTSYNDCSYALEHDSLNLTNLSNSNQKERHIPQEVTLERSDTLKDISPEKSPRPRLIRIYNTEESNVNGQKDKDDKNRQEKVSTPIIEVVQTDISVQQITVNTTDIGDERNECKLLEEKNLKNVCETSDPNSQLMEILKHLPESYSKQIIELIQNKKVDKPNKTVSTPNKTVEDGNSTRHQFITQSTPAHGGTEAVEFDIKSGDSHLVGNLCQSPLKLNYSNSDTGTREPEPGIMPHSTSFSDSVISVSPSQSIHYSMTSSDTFQTLNSPSVRLIDLECNFDKPSNAVCELGKTKDMLEPYVQEETNDNWNVNRLLFSQAGVTSACAIKQIYFSPPSIVTEEWAASVIGAYVKGYLTRRLLRTERVQALIDTIKDALVCALQLHNAENIDESDVELHRRLINQVSAACYAFHDIFFSLSIQEQMSVISADRQRKIEKAKRPGLGAGSSKCCCRPSSQYILNRILKQQARL